MDKKWILPTAAIICIISVVSLLYVIIIDKKGNTTNFIPPQFDSTAELGTPNPPENSGYSELDAHSFKFLICGNLISADNNVDVYFTNPCNNKVWLKVRIFDEQENVIGESGLIKPCEYIKTVKLKKLIDSTTNIKIKIMAYEPDTYYSAGAVTLNNNLIVK